MQPHMLWAAGVLLAALALVTLLVVFFSRRESTALWFDPGERPARGLAGPRARALDRQGGQPPDEQSIGEDTVLVLPDISGYTRFLTLNRFALGHAQYIILELLNAVIAAAEEHLRLCKLEGDAALLFAPARAIPGDGLSETILRIFAAFDDARERLAHSNLCPCKACQHVRDLDLKVFVHRGEASYFRLGDMIDVFGEEVIVLHRLMKSGVASPRYVLVSEAAKELVTLPGRFVSTEREIEIEGIGSVEASVYEVAPTCPTEVPREPARPEPSRWEHMLRKLKANRRTVSKWILGRHGDRRSA